MPMTVPLRNTPLDGLDGQVTPSSDPYLHVAIARGEVRILLGSEDSHTVENVDGFVDLDDGTTRTFTVLTLAEIARLMQKWESTGESKSGAHLRVADLIIVRAGGLPNVVAAVEELADGLPIIHVNPPDD